MFFRKGTNNSAMLQNCIESPNLEISLQECW